MKAGTIFLLFAYPVWAVISPMIASNGDTDLDSLGAHVLQLEQTVSNLQTQSHSQEQKYAAVLQSVLSKLTSTADELESVKTELNSLKAEHNTTRGELATVRAMIVSTYENCTQSNNNAQVLETNVTQMKTDIFNLKSDLILCEKNVTSIYIDVKKLDPTIESIVFDVRKLNSTVDVANHDITSIGSDISNLISNQNSTKKHFDTLESQVRTLGGTNVSFEVTLAQTVNASNVDRPIKFDRVLQNYGGGYQVDSGKFRAPSSGSYIVWSHVRVDNDGGLYMLLYKNGAPEIIGFTPGKLLFGVASLTTVLHLKQGDEVWVGKRTAVVSGEGFSSFGGVLIHPDLAFPS